MFIERPHTVPMCTIKRHPEGGWTPVLHMTGTEGPTPHADAISFPDVLSAIQWAHNHYGTVPLAIDDPGFHSRPA
ncbi:MAG: hypothetical protein ACTHKG_10830 [Nocardioides sp.]